MKSIKKIISQIIKVPRHFFVLLIKIYQKTLSPDHGLLKVFWPGGYCKFHPTCSEYGAQSILKYGIIKGGYLTIKRIFRCNPWNKGGHDPVK